MGSALSTTSTRVNSIKAHREKVCTDRDQKLGELEERVSDLERELNRSQQLCLQVEAQKSQATDELGMLREELERLNKELADSRASSASERVTQQLVRRLESELSTARQEVLDMRDHHEQQVQKVRASSAKSQAESALTVFELRDEIHRLSKENSLLREQVSRCQQEHKYSSQKVSGDVPGPTCHLQSRNSQLVIELSEQVTILSSELEQANLTISELCGPKNL